MQACWHKPWISDSAIHTREAHAGLRCGLHRRMLQAKASFSSPFVEDYWKRHQLFDCVALERKHRLAKAEIEARGNNLSAVDRCITARLNLIQLHEMKSYRFGFQVVSPDILQHGCFPVRVLTPLCFVEASMLLVPVKWVQTQKGPCALGDVYSMTTQKTGNVILWTSSHQNQLVALNAPWFIPTYWRLEASSSQSRKNKKTHCIRCKQPLFFSPILSF